MSKIDDPVRWERILRALIPDDAEWLSSRHEQLSGERREYPCKTAARKREARTQALRAAQPVIAPGRRPRPAAEAIVVELLRYLASAAWKEQQQHAELPPEAFERHKVLHRVAKLTKGETICWRLVFDALKELRPAKG